MTNGAKIFAQSNFGSYTLSMRDVNLYFELGFKCKKLKFNFCFKLFIASYICIKVIS